MTVADLLDIARAVQRREHRDKEAIDACRSVGDARRLAIWQLAQAKLLADGILGILDLPVGLYYHDIEADPGNRLVAIMDGSDDPQPARELAPDEARQFAVNILRNADEVDIANPIAPKEAPPHDP